MGNKINIIFGLLILVVSTTSLYIYSEDVCTRTDLDKFVIYEHVGKRCYILGEELYPQLYDGSSRLNRDRGDSYWNFYNDTSNNEIIVKRYTKFIVGPEINSTWIYDASTTDVERLPHTEYHDVINAEDYFFRYRLDNIKDPLPKRKLDPSETRLTFGKLKVRFDPGYNWGWIGWPYGADSFALQYDVPNKSIRYNIHLVDPVTTTVLINDNFNDSAFNGSGEFNATATWEFDGAAPTEDSTEITLSTSNHFWSQSNVTEATAITNNVTLIWRNSGSNGADDPLQGLVNLSDHDATAAGSGTGKCLLDNGNGPTSSDLHTGTGTTAFNYDERDGETLKMIWTGTACALYNMTTDSDDPLTSTSWTLKVTATSTQRPTTMMPYFEGSTSGDNPQLNRLFFLYDEESSDPDINITKSDDPDPVNAGEYIVYTLNITNNGSDTAHNISVVETYDSEVNFINASPAANSSNNVWTIFSLTNGDSYNITITVSVNSDFAGNVSNFVNVTNFSDSESTVSYTDVNDGENTTVDKRPKLDSITLGITNIFNIDNILLVSPANNSSVSSGDVNFTYNVSEQRVNGTSENLTITVVNLSSGSKNITDWRVNNSTTQESILIVNLPFEGNSTSSSTQDYSTKHNNATVSGATLNSTAGYDGFGAYEFDGVNDFITLGVSIVTDTETVEMRIRNATATYHLVNASGTTYIDGVQTDTPLPFNSTEIGVYPDGVFFSGTIDEFRIWNRTLSSHQVLLLYDNRTDIIHNNLTSTGDNWSIVIVPTNGTEDGVAVSSNGFVLEDIGVQNCSLNINNTVNVTNTSIVNEINNFTGISIGAISGSESFDWNVTCGLSNGTIIDANASNFLNIERTQLSFSAALNTLISKIFWPVVKVSSQVLSKLTYLEPQNQSSSVYLFNVTNDDSRCGRVVMYHNITGGNYTYVCNQNYNNDTALTIRNTSILNVTINSSLCADETIEIYCWMNYTAENNSDAFSDGSSLKFRTGVNVEG